MRALLLLLAPLVWSAPALGDIPAFFADLYERSDSCYMPLLSDEFSALCSAWELDVSDSTNQRTFHEIRFLHDMLTGSAAVDCATGGILEIPYFWHWVDPNPRHSILSLPDSTALSALEPPRGYRRYASLADVDRVPALFFSDLVSEAATYWHPACGEFFTFGWCSEREMAFLALAEALGYRGRVQQSGIHSWSELWCAFRQRDGDVTTVVAQVDNTFDSVDWNSPPAGTRLEEWQAVHGASRELKWYNAQAHSAEQRNGLRSIEVGALAAERISSQVEEALGCTRESRNAPRRH